MKIISLQLVAEHLSKSKEEVSGLLDSEIEQFSQYMSSIGDWKAVGPLSEMERALIKTYLIHKLREVIE